MKTKQLWGFLLAVGLLTACEKTPLDKEQYIKSIYMAKVTSTDMLHKVEIPYSDQEVETFVSVACGGSLVQDQDVTVTIKMAESAVDEYNTVQFPTEPEKYVIGLSNDRFRIPTMEAILQKEGESYAIIPIFVQNKGLDPDRTYVIPVTIDSVNMPDYLIQREISTILLGFTFTNPYKGNCTMEGTSDNGNGPRTIFGNKNLKAVDQHSVRLFAESYIESTEADKINTECIKLTFDDSQITVSGWGEMQASGIGSYDKAQGVIHLEYEFITSTGEIRNVMENLKYNKEL